MPLPGTEPSASTLAEDRIWIINPDGMARTVPAHQYERALRDGYRAPRDTEEIWAAQANEETLIREQATAHRNDQILVGIYCVVGIAAAILCGYWAYRLVRMVARRFVEERWAVLIAGLSVSLLSMGILAVPALIMLVRDMTRLPPKGA